MLLLYLAKANPFIQSFIHGLKAVAINRYFPDEGLLIARSFNSGIKNSMSIGFSPGTPNRQT